MSRASNKFLKKSLDQKLTPLPHPAKKKKKKKTNTMLDLRALKISRKH